MPPNSSAPVLVIAYRRPEKVSKVFEAIRNQGPRLVYLFCDGPESIADEKAQNEIARVVDDLSPELKVLTRFEPMHLGLRGAVTAALDWFFCNESAGVILEDDIVPTPAFFTFCDSALDHYEPDKRIQQISGSNLFGNLLQFSSRHILSTRMEVWGWATWADRWHDFRTNEEHWEAQPDGRWSPSSVVREIEKGHRRAQSGELDTWDYTWAWYAITRQKLCLISKVNLTTNIGFDNSATHTKSGKPFKTGTLNNTTKYPSSESPDRLYDRLGQLLRLLRLERFRLIKRLQRFSKWLHHVWQRIFGENLYSQNL